MQEMKNKQHNDIRKDIAKEKTDRNSCNKVVQFFESRTKLFNNLKKFQDKTSLKRNI